MIANGPERDRRRALVEARAEYYLADRRYMRRLDRSLAGSQIKALAAFAAGRGIVKVAELSGHWEALRARKGEI